jgi:hypothetical protein
MADIGETTINFTKYSNRLAFSYCMLIQPAIAYASVKISCYRDG